MQPATHRVDTRRRGIFPLHMTPFETYMLVDDSPRYPMTFVIQLRLSGNLDRTRWQTSVDRALERHPLLRSLIRPAKSNRDCWVYTEGYSCPVEWAELGTPIRIPGAGARIDLRNEIGVRSWGRHDDQRAELTFAFHHTATDGIGAYQFLGDVLWHYAEQCGATLPPQTKIDPNNLRRRLQANVSRELVAWAESAEERLAHEPAEPLAGSRDGESDGETLQDFPRFFEHRFDKKEYRRLRLSAQDAGLTINDRLLKGLLITLAEWNAEQGRSSDRNICINMPLDLRQPNQPEFSASNVVTCAFIRRDRDQILDREGLDPFLREEAIRVKHTRLESDFMKLLVQSPIDLGDAATSYASDDCLATAIFSNTGDPTRRFLTELPREKGVVQVGDLVLDDLAAVSPLRDQTRLAVGIFTYKRELKIVIRTDPFHFTSDDSQRLLQRYVHHFCEG